MYLGVFKIFMLNFTNRNFGAFYIVGEGKVEEQKAKACTLQTNSLESKLELALGSAVFKIVDSLCWFHATQ
jgi:hypothetical protein